ncbi:MAG: ComEA family DNA-binding protein [Flavobacteriaceae bacterium]
MNKLKSHFNLNKQERSGIFFLLLLIFLFQSVYFIIKSIEFGSEDLKFNLDTHAQEQLDSLIASAGVNEAINIKPFNPNFISDYKGYVLGMSPDEIDRLHQFRESGRFLNSSIEFQRITKISDSLLERISVHFKFPDWTVAKNKSVDITKENSSENVNRHRNERLDINQATAEHLMSVPGIGPVLSKRIIKFRNALGGFITDEQLLDVYGLDREVVERLLKRYAVFQPPEVKQLSLQNITAEELSKLVYISYQLATRIIHYRDSLGSLDSVEQLTKIQDFPSEKINRIKLYLTL